MNVRQHNSMHVLDASGVVLSGWCGCFDSSIALLAGATRPTRGLIAVVDRNPAGVKGVERPISPEAA